jgi:hypothetical protein
MEVQEFKPALPWKAAVGVRKKILKSVAWAAFPVPDSPLKITSNLRSSELYISS